MSISEKDWKFMEEVASYFRSTKDTDNPEGSIRDTAIHFDLSRNKVRKILITTGDIIYPQTQQIQALIKSEMSIGAVAEKMGISISSVNSLLPYSKGVYGLDVSAAADRTLLYRVRKQIIIELKDAIQTGDWSLELWKAICLFQNYPFTTSGRGSVPGKKYKYSLSKEGGTGGRRYAGEQVEGYGNEMWIVGKEKSISRSTVELGYKKAREMEIVKGPKALGLPGSGSYLYPIFMRFGICRAE